MAAFLEWLRCRREINKLDRARTFGIGGGSLFAMTAFMLLFMFWNPIAWLMIAFMVIVGLGLLVTLVLAPLGLIVL